MPRLGHWPPLAVFLLSVLVALGGVLPAYARLSAGPRAHACHCATGRGHAHCSCPICFPELDVDIDVHREIKGKCGDDDTGWRTLSEPAVVAAVGVLAPVIQRRASLPLHHAELLPRMIGPPEPPPPRRLMG